MIRLKKSVMTVVFLLTAAFVFAGCGNNPANDNNSGVGASTENTGRQENTTSDPAGDTDNMDDAAGDLGDAAKDVADDAGDAAKDVADDAGDAAKDVADDAGDAAKDVADDAGDAAKDMVDDAGKAADDVADGVGDAIDNLGGGSFDTYGDAKTYLLEKLSKDNAGANYEVRNETEDLTAYNNNDSGAEGYQFSVYETDGNEKIGIYYVDKDTGKIYRYMGKNSIEAY